MLCRVPRWVAPWLVCALAASLRLGARWNAELVIPPVDGQILFGQSSGDEDDAPDPGSARASQRVRKTGTERSAEYAFMNFNQDRLKISYSITEPDFQRYNKTFGYREEEIVALRQWRDDVKQRAYQSAARRRVSQAKLDAEYAAVDKEYDRKFMEYMHARGFRIDPGNVTRVDMKAIVKKNAAHAKPIAQSFEKVATARRYRSPDIIGAVLSFVQTAMHYKQPDAVYKGKHTGGLLPPITAVLLGWGDCDTKTGVLASILANWAQMRMVGISVPGHYLMAVLEIPDKGDLYVEHQGLQYVLLEPAGPAWLPPGRVADETVAQLNSAEGYKIEPFF